MSNIVEMFDDAGEKMMTSNAPAAHSKLTQKANLQ